MSPRHTTVLSRRRQILSERALGFRRSPTWSEAILWEHLRGGALGVSFRRQVPVGGRFVADFFASEIGLIVEVDGGYHEQRRRLDAKRDDRLRRLGFVVVHVAAEVVERDPGEAVGVIRAAVGRIVSVAAL